MSGALDVELQYAKLRRAENRADHTDFALISACEEIKDLEQQLVRQEDYYTGDRKRIADLEQQLAERQWISVEDRLPPNEWMGLVVADVRPDNPVFAHRPSVSYERNFPYAGHFIGRWRESLLIGDHMRDKARVIYWLETDRVYPPPPEEQDNG